MANNRSFKLAAVLTVVSGNLFPGSSIKDLYELLMYLLNRKGLVTCELPEAMKLAAKELKKQIPALKKVSLLSSKRSMEIVLNDFTNSLGKRVKVTRLNI